MNNDFRVDFAIRNFVWFVIFVLVCLVCVVNILLPRIYEYKKQAIETKKVKVVFNQIYKDYRSIESQLRTFVGGNYGMLERLHNEGDENKIQGIMQESFMDVRVKKLSVTRESDMVSVQYQAVGYADSTQAIENFIAYANSMPFVTKVELPLKMDIDEKSGQIYFEMMLNLKNSTYAEHQIILDNQLRFSHLKP